LVVKVNLMGTLLCTKAALDIMGEQASSSTVQAAFCSNVNIIDCSTLLTVFLILVPRLE
jgi:hypothetical protein